MPPPHVDARQEATMYQADLHELHISSEVAVQTDTERNTVSTLVMNYRSWIIIEKWS